MQGNPGGANAFGFSGRPPNWGWAHVWFAAFATWVLSLPIPLQIQVDYLLPDMILEAASDGPKYRIFACPMPYIKALNMFRTTLARVHASLGMVQASARVMAAAYSLHLKVAVLSWPCRLDLEERHRSDQGRRRSQPLT